MFMLISGLIGDLHHESHVCIIIVALRFSDLLELKTQEIMIENLSEIQLLSKNYICA